MQHKPKLKYNYLIKNNKDNHNFTNIYIYMNKSRIVIVHNIYKCI